MTIYVHCVHVKLGCFLMMDICIRSQIAGYAMTVLADQGIGGFLGLAKCVLTK